MVVQPEMFIIVDIPSIVPYNFEPGKNASMAFRKLPPIQSKMSLEPSFRSISRSSVFIDCDSCAATITGSKSSTYGSNIFLASEVLLFFLQQTLRSRFIPKTKTARISRSQPTCWPMIF